MSYLSLTSPTITGPLAPARDSAVNGLFNDSRAQRRIQIRAELAKVEAILKQYPLEDGMTKKIAIWREQFSKSLRSEDNAQIVLEKFVILLEQLLRNPVTESAIDDEPLLGIDGRTYGKKFLSIFLYRYQCSQVAGSPEALRCPLAPDKDEAFSVTPHPVVKHMITEWLQKYNRFRPSEEEDKSYRELVQTGKLPRLLTPSLAKIQYVLAKQAQAKQERKEEKRVDPQPIGNQVRALGDGLRQRLAERMGVAQERIQQSQNQSNNAVRSLEQRDKETRERLEKESKQRRQEIEQLRNEIRGLNGELAELREDTQAMKAEQIQIEISIKQLEMEIKERQSNWMEDVIKIGASIVLTLCLREAGVAVSARIL